MKHKLTVVVFALFLAACGKLTATPTPTATPDLAAIRLAVEERPDATATVKLAAAMDTPTTSLVAPAANTSVGAPSVTATELPTGTPTPASQPAIPAASPGTAIALPPPMLTGGMSLEEALSKRRSVRQLDGWPLTLAELGQLLWAAQGITDEAGHRTAPSAGSSYPLELFVATEVGVFHYDPGAHQLIAVSAEDARTNLYRASGEQESVRQAPVIFVVAAVYERTVKIYGEERGHRYVQLEAGHATENLLLEATALGFGVVSVGAFDDREVQEALGLPKDQQPLYLVPVGHARVGDQ